MLEHLHRHVPEQDDRNRHLDFRLLRLGQVPLRQDSFAARGQPRPRRRAGEQTVRVPRSARRAAASLHSSQPFPRRQLRNQRSRLQSQHPRGQPSRPLPALLLSQYYLSCGYSGNLIYARVIEAELDKQGKLSALHAAVEKRAKKPWADIQKNLSFYRTHLYNAACEVAPEVFSSPAGRGSVTQGGRTR